MVRPFFVAQDRKANGGLHANSVMSIDLPVMRICEFGDYINVVAKSVILDTHKSECRLFITDGDGLMSS